MPGATKLEQASAVLAELPSEELIDTIQSVLSERLGPHKAAVLRVYIAAFLDEEDQVDRLAGHARNAIAHMDTERLQQLFIRSAAHRAVLDEPLLESSAVAEALGRTGTNGREAASKLRLAGRLVGVRQQNRFLYPAFQFDLEHNQVHQVAADVNRVLDALHDPWGVASWWITANPRIEGRAPKDLLGTTQERDVLALAHSESSE